MLSFKFLGLFFLGFQKFPGSFLSFLFRSISSFSALSVVGFLYIYKLKKVFLFSLGIAYFSLIFNNFTFIEKSDDRNPIVIS